MHSTQGGGKLVASRRRCSRLSLTVHYDARMGAEDEASAATAEVAQAIGRRVKAGRAERGWTLQQLAERSGVSRRMLINVEHGSTNPSIATLLRLADALAIGLPALVDTAHDTADPISVHRAGEVPAIATSEGGGSAVMVAGTNPPDITELWDWRLDPGGGHKSEAHRAGTRELLLVLSGAIDLVVADREVRLKTGDAASFDGTLAHGYRNASTSRPARFTLSVHEPGVE